MDLEQLASGIPGARIVGDSAVNIRSIEYDSRKVKSGTLFLAVRGFKSDGNAYIAQALQKGAAAVLTDEQSVECSVPVVHVADSRKAMALVADRFNGSPQSSLVMTAVTGTNGKTTTSYLVKSIFEAGGMGCGLIGTIRHIVGNETIQSNNTTPEAPDIHSFLSRMAAEKQSACVMEVSSHALVLSRVYGIRFRAAAFTNLTRDHLDFHGDFNAYLGAKSLLFSNLSGDSTAVINGDDPVAGHMRSVSRGGRILAFGFGDTNDLRPENLEMDARGSRFRIRSPFGMIPISLSLPGRFNVMNALTAAGIALGCGIPLDIISSGLASVRAVEGRFQTVDAGQDFAVIVDYAHTPDALERILSSVREITRGRVISVFGCGGDRDRGKRPLMGGISTRLADHTVITSDNPRTEDPLAIIAEITAGVDSENNFEVVHDRESAIRRALELAKPGDSVVIAGKGHEDYQIIGTTKIHFDDAETARRILEDAR